MTSNINASENLPTLFCDDIVWDSSRFNIVLNMTVSECQTMAKRTARQLREDSPKFVEAFKQLSDLHQSVATSSISLCVFDSHIAQGEELGAAEEKVVKMSKRRLDRSEERLEQVRNTLDQYRKATGYRAFCLLAIGADGSVDTETKRAASALHMLNGAQKHHLEMLLLIEKFKACQKIDAADKVGTMADEIKTIHGLLDSHLASSLRKLFKVDFLVEGRSTAELNESLLSAACQGNTDPTLMTLAKTDCAIQVFRSANRAITSQLSLKVNKVVDDILPTGKIFPNAA